LAPDAQQSHSLKTLLADKSREMVQAGSAMKAQAWASGINAVNADTSSTGYSGLPRQVVQSETTTLLQPADAQPASAWLHPVVHSAMQPSVVNTAALIASSSLPCIFSSNNTAAERAVVDSVSNTQYSYTVLADSLTLGTPMKRVDSISASAGHTKTSTNDAVSVKNPSSSRRLHDKSNTVDGRGRDGYMSKRLDGKFGLHPQVQSIADHHSDEALELQDRAATDFRSVQQQPTGDMVNMHASLHSAALDNQAVGQVSVNAEISSTSLTPAETVSSHSSTAEYATAADRAVDADRVQLFLPHKNTRLNELWNRFTLDYTVCCPHATDSVTTFSASSVEQTENGVVESSTRRSSYQHSEQSFVCHATGDKSQGAKDHQKQQFSADELQTSNLLVHSSSAAVCSTANVHAGHRGLSSGSNTTPQHITKPSHGLHEASSHMENKSESRKPSKSGDAGKPSLSAVVPVKRAWIIKDETLPVVPEESTLDSVSSDFLSASSVDDMGNVITCTTKRRLPNDPKLLRLQQKIAQQREKHRIVHRNELRRKEHIIKMELALQERQKAIEQRTRGVQKMGDDHPSSSQLEVTASSSLLTTVTGNDSDVTSSVQLTTDSSQSLSSYDTSASCPCRQAQCGMHRVISPKENSVLPKKQRRSETTFRPNLREVDYTKTKVTESAPSLLSREKISHEQERNAAVTKNVRRKVVLSSASHGTRIPETGGSKNGQGDQRSRSKITKSSKMNKPSSQSKVNYSDHVLTEKNKPVTKERGMQSKGVQTTPRLRDSRVLYASTEVPCPADWSHFDELGIISRHGLSRGQHMSSLSSKIFSTNSSTDAELLQRLKHKSWAKQPVRAFLPRELFVHCW